MPLRDMGIEAFDILIRAINGDGIDAPANVRRVFPTELVIRNSTGAPPGLLCSL
jgi:DNA-binding LacI/PurR family transcriptional regulator